MWIKIYLSLASLWLAPLALACGPWLPEAYIVRNDDLFYEPPKVGFAAELEHLLPESVPYQAVLNGEKAGGASAARELREALTAAGEEPEFIEAVISGFTSFRSTLNDAKSYLDTPPYPGRSVYQKNEERDAKIAVLESLRVPENLPQEFRLYLAGALAYYRSGPVEARVHWEALMQLPEKQRHYRSVMAAFMLAKTCPQKDPSNYVRVRALAERGFADSLGLAAASYGRQAQLYLKDEAYLPAVELYLKQWASGYGNAVQSLELTAGRIFGATRPDEFSELVKSEEVRSVLTAYLLTHHHAKYSERYRQRLAEALPDIKSLELPEAGRFALMEYQENNLSASRLWLSHAEAEDALALWIRSKLLLRAGKIKEGRTLMLALTESFQGQPPEWRRLDTGRAWGELGLLYMREARYPVAADAFWNAGSWRDCAYVLERLLTMDELLVWMKNHHHSDQTGDARALTARRLMREAQFERALEFFSPGHRADAERYIRSMKAAHDRENEASVRARHFWDAARTMRYCGMQLFGAELAPDHTRVNGRYDWGDLGEARNDRRWGRDYQINAVTRQEIDRNDATRIVPNKRFHYRYRAVQLAELAAGLLPNNDEDASRIYVISASWIQKRDPEAANRLFKQLAVRCADTELGKASLTGNWFPELDLKDYEPFSDE